MKASNLKSGFILSYAAIFIQSVISIMYTPVMIRLLGQTDYGLLQLAVSTVSNLGILSFGFGSSYLRFYSKYKASDDARAISALNGMFAVIFTAVAVISLIAGGIVTFNTDLIFSNTMSAGELSTLKILLGIMTVNLAVSFPCTVFDSYIMSQERFSFQKALTIVTSLLNPMLTFPLLIAGKGPVSAAVCTTVITAVRLIASMVFCLKRLKMTFIFTFDKSVFKQLFVFSFFVFLNIISDQINWNVDKTLLGIIKGSESVAVYSVGSQFNSYFLTFSYALSSLLSPRAYSLVSKTKNDRLITKFFAEFGRWQFIVMGYIFMIFLAVGKPFMRLWSGIDSDIPYYTALLLISPLLITSIQSIGIEIQRAKDMHRFRSVLYIMTAGINIALSIPLCVKYGALGCAAGTCAVLIIGNIIIMNVYYHKRVGINIFYFWREIFKFIPSLVLPAASIILIRHFIWENFLSVIVCGIVFSIIYAGSVFLFGLNGSERKLITKRKN
ncbi:MAG: oligosaccharide flippase family protein [Firmicutes bacterium]|nr:oligosaccharide flippase family protein [Bacillota bacterium]